MKPPKVFAFAMLLVITGAIVVPFGFERVALAQTVNSTWNGGTGNWSTSADWTPNGSPNNGGGKTFNVTIDSGGSDSVTLDITATISSLVLGGTSGGSALTTTSGNNLTVSGALTINRTGTLVANSTVSVATLASSGVIIINPGATLNLTSQPGGITDVPAGSTLTLGGTFTAGSNSGLVGLNSIEGTLDLQNGQTANVTPISGTLTVNSGGVLALSGTNGATTLNIRGNLTNSGAIGTNTFFLGFSGDTLTVSGTLTNNSGASLTVGNCCSSADVLTAGSLINNGVMTVESGASLTVSGNASNSSSMTLNGTGTISGSFTNQAGGGLAVTAGRTFIGALTNDSGASVTVGNCCNVAVLAVGSLINNGSITVNAPSTLELTSAGTATNSTTLTLNGTLEVGANVTLSGRGTVNMNGGIMTGAASANTLTNSNNTIQGYGNIGNSLMTLNNQSTIDANSTTASLIIQTSGGATNSGTLEATNGATLQLDAGIYTQTGKGTIQATGTTSTSTVLLESGVVINGGRLTTSKTNGLIETVAGGAATLNGVTNSGTVQVVDTSTVTLAGSNTNTGAIKVGDASGSATLFISGNVTLSGTGKVTLSNSANNLVTGSPGSVLANSNTIQGAGNIGNGTVAVTNNGTISANQSTALLVDTSSAGLTNNGTLSVSKGDTLDIEGGQLTNFNSGTSTLTGGTYSVSGTLQLLNTSGTIATIGNGTTATSVTMTGSTAKFLNQNGQSMLTNLGTIAAAGTFATGGGFNFTTAGIFTNNGTLNVGSGTSFVVNLASGTLTNFNSSTMTLAGGNYIVGGTLQFASANIATLAANTSITLASSKAQIIDQSNNNGLAHFATNDGTFSLSSGANFTTPGKFTNNGTLSVASGTTFAVGTGFSLTNLSVGTLSSGTYTVGGTLTINGDITTNDANISLTSTTAIIKDASGSNSLTNSFTNNGSTGSFTLSGNATFTSVSSGAFSNAGIVSVSKGSQFTVGGTQNYNQTGGTTTVDGTLALGAGGTVNITAGNVFGGGTITGTVSMGGSGTFNVGDNGSAGLLSITGNYTQLSTAAMNVSIGGTAAGSQFSQLSVNGNVTLAGTLTATEVNKFTPKMGQTFMVINVTGTGHTLTGTFSNSTIAINSTEHFSISYTVTTVVLTVVAGAAPTETPRVPPATTTAYNTPKPVSGTSFRDHGKDHTTRSGSVSQVPGKRPLGGAQNRADHAVVSSGSFLDRAPRAVAGFSGLRSGARSNWQYRFADHAPEQYLGASTLSTPQNGQLRARFLDHNPERFVRGWAPEPQIHRAPQVRLAGNVIGRQR